MRTPLETSIDFVMLAKNLWSVKAGRRIDVRIEGEKFVVTSSVASKTPHYDKVMGLTKGDDPNERP